MNETIKIERMGYGAAAVGRLASGKTVFVEGAAPGEVCEVHVVQDKPSFAIADLVRVQEESEHRALAHESTPGAPWAHLAYPAQLAAKRQNLVEALVRTGSVARADAETLVANCIPSKREWGYRNKIELAAFRDETGRFALGMHEAGSHQTVALQKAPLANRLIERAPKALTGALRYLQGADDLGIYRVGVRGSVRTKSVEVALWTPPSAFPRTAVAKTLCDAVWATSIVRIIAEPGKARRVKKIEALEGQGFWKEDLADISFSVSAPSFFQVNTAQAEKLVRLVLDGLALDEGDLVADLYCGVGTFSLPLFQTGAEVVAVELEGSSVRDLRRNAEFNGCDIDVIGDDVARVLPALGRLDAVVVDPPRAGLDKSVIGAIAEAHPMRIAYVSCDPQTFARDVARLAAREYRLVEATPVDLFPQTYHQETVGIFATEAAEARSHRFCT
ncbi:23S rRNA (uracil(1939)-C(5))-methyltransferase RlmD [Adlercreutzia murintestinalis]|uniref:23S rRNA (uracil(1939)-C(5))-methyltransferase RlmD n=1 Tax=Adlercreutzia murintestinalis TaxID=2941325 RepID=UPI0020418245|nr:23S rRNA (uracil(1939)-C(5))-methyltransferase RlmD [Adlercreutzia murintestinalis]